MGFPLPCCATVRTGKGEHRLTRSPVLLGLQEAVDLLVVGTDARQHAVEDVEVALALVLLHHARLLQEVLVDLGSLHCTNIQFIFYK